jgi:outer membrane protein OmpA-like peptidoglycan-associated protein
MTDPTFSRRRLAALAIMLIPLATAACTGDQQGRRPATPSQSAPRTAPAGGLIGGHDSRTRALASAGVAPVAGIQGGAYVDRLETDLKARTAGTGIDLARRGNEVILTIPSRIAFDGNGASIAPGIRTTLDAVARLLAQYHQSFVDVSGFAEQSLDDQTANSISQSQAQALANYLQLRSVLAARIGAQGFGRSTTAAGRRVEIKLVPFTYADLPPSAAPNAAR